jgi:hypothetical protein
MLAARVSTPTGLLNKNVVSSRTHVARPRAVRVRAEQRQQQREGGAAATKPAFLSSFDRMLSVSGHTYG